MDWSSLIDLELLPRFLFVFALCLVNSFVLIGADLISGIRRAKRSGEYTMSSKLRKTTDKVVKYALFSTVCVFVDFLCFVSFPAIFGKQVFSVPVFCIISTLITALFEGKSIIENTKNEAVKNAWSFASILMRKYGDDVVRLLLQKILSRGISPYELNEMIDKTMDDVEANEE